MRESGCADASNVFFLVELFTIGFTGVFQVSDLELQLTRLQSELDDGHSQVI